MSLFRIFGASSAAEREEEKAAEAARDSRDKLTAAVDTDLHQPPKFDAVSVLEGAGVVSEQRERVERTLELLSALPAETPAAIRKNIVEASLKAFDISIRAIVEAAAAEVAAFDSYVASGHKQLDELRKQSEDRIAQLESEIAKIEKRLDIATSDQASLDQATMSAVERVRPVLGFFTETSPPKVANDSKNHHPPSIIIDDSLTKAG